MVFFKDISFKIVAREFYLKRIKAISIFLFYNTNIICTRRTCEDRTHGTIICPLSKNWILHSQFVYIIHLSYCILIIVGSFDKYYIYSIRVRVYAHNIMLSITIADIPFLSFVFVRHLLWKKKLRKKVRYTQSNTHNWFICIKFRIFTI